MNIEHGVILIWCCVWLSREAVTFRLFNRIGLSRVVLSTMEEEEYKEIADGDTDNGDDGEEEDDSDYKMFIAKVKANGQEYTGTLIAADIVVADPATKTDTTEVCTYEGEECHPASEITVVDKVANLQIGVMMAKPLFWERDVLGMKCRGVAVNRDPVEASVTNKGVICEQCKEYDAIICEKRLAGVVVGQPEFELIRISTLREKAGLNIEEELDDEKDISEMADNLYDDQDDVTEGEEWLSMRKSDASLAYTTSKTIIIVVCIVTFSTLVGDVLC